MHPHNRRLSTVVVHSLWQVVHKPIHITGGLDPVGDRDRYALAQTVKLGEEVGELNAEILGAIKYCRNDKASQFNSESLAGELADVMVCTFLLADIFEVDLPAALTSKMDFLRSREF
jgi:NTP pyrophosphatase (non-canonical NTP hydrolase)